MFVACRCKTIIGICLKNLEPKRPLEDSTSKRILFSSCLAPNQDLATSCGRTNGLTMRVGSEDIAQRS